jgi:site-specific recombinase XerD
MLITTGIRASELIALSMDDVDLDAETVRVVGRQGRERSIAMLRLPVAGLEAYLLARVNHRYAAISSSLWLGEKGPLTASGLRQMLERRCALADIRSATPHLFRRTFAHEALRRGMSHESLMDAGGWLTDQMPRRYAPRATETG